MIKKKVSYNFLKYAAAILLPFSFLFLNSTVVPDMPDGELDFLKKPAFSSEKKISWADSVFNTLSPDERIGQLFMIPVHPELGSANKEKVSTLIKDYKVGGLIMFQGGPVRQAKLTNYYQSISPVPLMIAGDYEWGLSMRLDSTVRYPRQMMLGAIQNERLLYKMGAEFARQFKRIGVHINFAPVIDINNNPNNPVINSRSFGEQKINVARKGAMYMFGMQDRRILAVGKHFPGHGDTDTDSHYALPIIRHDYNRLKNVEMYPFKYLTEHGLGGIMTAHLHIPELDSTPNLASSISKKIVSGILKDKLNFRGLIFTDALGMKGVSQYFEPGETEVKALIAGTDVLLMPRDVPAAFKAIKKAIASGALSQKDIDRRVKKILAAKKWFGLDEYKAIKTKGIYEDLNTDSAKMLRRKLIESALTLAVNKEDLIPFKSLDSLDIASLAIGNGAFNSFQKRMSNYADVKHYQISKTAGKQHYNSLLKRLAKRKVVVVSLHNTNRRPPSFGLQKESLRFIEKLSEKTKVVLVHFGNPYALQTLKKPEKLQAVLIAYNDWRDTRDIAAQILFGGIAADGKLPVSSGSYFKAGTGISKERIRLKYSLPAELKIRYEKLKSVDSVILKAIEDGATPGASVMAIKDGIVFYQKSFGYHSYQKKQRVKNDDLFDLASITKIAASVPALMRLYEQGKIKLNQPLSKYLPELDSTNKRNLRINDILAHQARLKAWIPFYLQTYSDRANFILDTAIYSSVKSDRFPLEVAKNMYMNQSYVDSMYQRIYDSKLRRRKKYKYSDLGYYMFYRMIEKITQEKFEVYTQKNFYAPLGAVSMGFRPLQRFEQDRILPTENDTKFRKQVLRGYVHDYGAAMTGGVNGHAGLFASADDLAKLMQMYLQFGEYGGKRYFKAETIKLFSSQAFPYNDNRRALGFDKPQRPEGGPTTQAVSDASFGHSGFTGTYAWADPEYNFVYIFLSNRIHPDIQNRKLISHNVRTKVQRLFYESFPDYKAEKK